MHSEVRIVRASATDTDLFSTQELACGGCCFVTQDRQSRYRFAIAGRTATLLCGDARYIDRAIDAFLFYSGFVTRICDRDGALLRELPPIPCRTQDILQIQPSQFYISERKLQGCKGWMTDPQDIWIPVVERDGKTIALDGHTRLRAALELGCCTATVYPESTDDYIFDFAAQAVARGIGSVADMELLGEQQYREKWHDFCDRYFTKAAVADK